jgi:formylglycine-generating enzyme required for sulfatase activity
MKNKIGTLALKAMLVASVVQADSITHNGTTINMDFVNIGNAGNLADFGIQDNPGYGAVGYNYRIGQKEVTINQFAMARAADARISDGNEGYWNSGTRTVGSAAPASRVTVYEAMKYANWLTSGDAYTGAYQFDGSGALQAVDRDAAVAAYGTVYVLPTEDEWYKAAYYKPVNDGTYSSYANGINAPSSVTHGTSSGWNYYLNTGGYAIGAPNYAWETGFGAEEQNGTYDMMGNVWEWTESAFDGRLNNMGEDRVYRGGSYSSTAPWPDGPLRSSVRVSNGPTIGGDNVGFRVAAIIPEPASLAFIGLFGGGALFIRRMFMM